ncbi:MAG: hypothetical protein RL757_1512 [Bacteroidota bacterium]|jgi:hypothetical protein
MQMYNFFFNEVCFFSIFFQFFFNLLLNIYIFNNKKALTQAQGLFIQGGGYFFA